MSGMDTSKIPSVVVTATEQTRLLGNSRVDNQQHELEIEAKKIDAYFGDRKLPLAGAGMTIAIEAKKNNLPYTLVAAIAMRESTGGKFDCKYKENNYWGWGSCKIGFKSLDEAIASMSENLSGNDPDTAHYYKGKDIDGILRTYNQVIPNYVGQVKGIMAAIENYDIS